MQYNLRTSWPGRSSRQRQSQRECMNLSISKFSLFAGTLAQRCATSFKALLPRLVPALATQDYAFPVADIARLHAIGAARAGSVDQATWQGLLLETYFAELATGASVFGQQLLYRDLRDGLDDAGRAALVVRLQALEDGAARERLAQLLRPLRAADTEVATLLFEERAAPASAWAGWYWLLLVGLAASVAAVAWSPLGWLGAFFFVFQMVAAQTRYHLQIDHWNRRRASLQQMLRSCSLAAASNEPALAAFAPLKQQAGRVNRALADSAAQRLPIVGIYLDWLLQANVEHYFRTVKLMTAQRDFLRHCYLLCAQLDADLALARHRAARATCWARRGDGITLDDAIHPLLDAPAALSIALQQGAFISGQNGVGKSTLLRTVGLNLLTARAFGFCYARSAQLPMLPVMSSMQSEDSLLDGASLYVAELTRARALLDAAAEGATIFLIDEIFRGTNHHEAVAAAAAVLDELAAKSIVLVSSHNLVLASLLEHRLLPLCVSRSGDGGLQLAPGVLLATNGIALLAQHGFSEAVDAKARRVFGWLDGFLAQPPGGAAVLAPAAAPAAKRAA